MNRVTTALAAGKLSIALSGALLRDPEVMLLLRERASLRPMALSGVPTAPCIAVADAGIARAVSGPGGVLVLVEPEGADMGGMKALGELLSRVQNKPQVLVVARSFNPLSVSMMMPGIAVAHLKGRGKQFVSTLQVPDGLDESPVAKVAKTTKSRGNENAPRFQFIGREDELKTLGEMLAEPGPIVVSGPQGVGRTWLVNHAIAGTELKRLHDLSLFFGAGFDTLVARLAEITKRAGADQLVKELKNESRTPVSLIEASIAALQASETGDQVLVVQGLDHFSGREADFFRKSRLELLLMALLTKTYPLRVVFVAERQPVFYREQAAASLRRLELGGLKGKEYYDLFQAYKAPEFPRDKIGPLTEKVHGHPMAIRAYAVAVRDGGIELLDNPKYMKATDIADLTALKRTLGKRLEKLSKPAREALAKLAHFPYPIDGSEIAELGIGRNGRLELLALGLLDMTGTEAKRLYRVHPLIRSLLSWREVNDFTLQSRLSERFGKASRDADHPVTRLAYQQEANRCAIAGRNARNRRDLDYPDHDALVESTFGMMRGQRPNFTLAQQRLMEVLRRDPSNADAHLAKLELMSRMKEPAKILEEAADQAMTEAPVPEVFHQAVGYALGRRARGKAISVLQRAVEVLPDDSRLRTRLASLMMRQGRRPEAIEQLQKAMDLDPMLPDAYGVLGMARRDEGLDKLDEAETLLREAVRLAPQDPVQVSRLVGLLLDRARISEGEAVQRFRDEARERMDEVLKGDRPAPEIQLLYAVLIREEGKEIERAAWFLKKARKQLERRDRPTRLRVEEALLQLARGELDAAEQAVRQLVSKEPSNARVFQALSQVLEARQQFIPAHAELLRAKERTHENSLVRVDVERQLLRLQAVIEAQAAGLYSMSAPTEQVSSLPSLPPVEPRVIVRKRTVEPDAAVEEPTTDAEAVNPTGEGRIEDGVAAEGELAAETAEATSAEATRDEDPVAETTSAEATSAQAVSAEGADEAADAPTEETEAVEVSSVQESEPVAEPVAVAAPETPDTPIQPDA